MVASQFLQVQVSQKSVGSVTSQVKSQLITKQVTNLNRSSHKSFIWFQLKSNMKPFVQVFKGTDSNFTNVFSDNDSSYLSACITVCFR